MTRSSDEAKTMAAWEMIHRECWFAYQKTLAPDDPRRRYGHGHVCAKDGLGGVPGLADDDAAPLVRLVEDTE